MSSERADQPATPDTPQGIPGQTLAAQREALGWSVEQVADQLKLAVRQVVALEAGDYASLPSPAVTRGFVRAYAKLMKLDPVPLVAQIAMDTPPAPDTSAQTAARRPTPASFSQAKFPSHGKRVKLPLGWIGGIVVVVVAAGAAWHFGLIPGGHRDDGATATTVGTPAASGASPEAAGGSSVETLQNPSVPLISVPGASASASAPAAAAPTTAPTTGPVVNVPGAGATGAAPTTVPAPAATPPVTQAAPAVAATAAAAQQAAGAPAGANALVLNVREDSWIEVRPARGGNALISRLVKGGSTETVNVDGPVRLVVGNPGAVTATLRGTAVALPPVPGKTISRVNLQ